MAETPTVVTDARGRKLSIRLPDAGDQFDLIEIAGAVADNRPWMFRAMVVYAVSAIDGVPLPLPASKDDLKTNARALGDDGIMAVMESLFPEAVAAARAADARARGEKLPPPGPDGAMLVAAKN